MAAVPKMEVTKKALEKLHKLPSCPPECEECDIISRASLGAHAIMRGPVKESFRPANNRASQSETSKNGSGDTDLHDLTYSILMTHEGLADTPKNPGFHFDDEEKFAHLELHLTGETFLKFAEGAERWYEDPIHRTRDLGNTDRIHHGGPPKTSPREHQPLYLGKAKTQKDKYTGEEISPEYLVPTNPSLLFSPPGICDYPRVSWEFLGRYYDMVHVPLSKYFGPNYKKGEASVWPRGTDSQYTDTEVKLIGSFSWPIDRYQAKITGASLQIRLAVLSRAISDFDHNNKVLAEETEEQGLEISDLAVDHKDLLSIYIPKLREIRSGEKMEERHDYQAYVESVQESPLASETAQKKQAETDSVREELDKEYRRARIREHVNNTLLEQEFRLDMALLKFHETQELSNRQKAQIKRLKMEIREQCLLVGKSGIQGVYDEINQRLGYEAAPGVFPAPQPEKGSPTASTWSNPSQRSVELPESVQDFMWSLFDQVVRKPGYPPMPGPRSKSTWIPEGKWILPNVYEMDPGPDYDHEPQPCPSTPRPSERTAPDRSGTSSDWYTVDDEESILSSVPSQYQASLREYYHRRAAAKFWRAKLSHDRKKGKLSVDPRGFVPYSRFSEYGSSCQAHSSESSSSFDYEFE
ncbi:hypothetical protein F4804DRAFT_313348 [Jackrogersella minutella]|nr:hypothetical protein F4804DRAFT_313348 [Jackrogersella minutella]